MNRRATPEGVILAACLDLLRLRGWSHWRNNTGAARYGPRLVRFGIPGAADILAIVPGSGRFCAIECKAPGGRLTAAQRAFLDAVDAAGGVAVVIRDVGWLNRVLAYLEEHPTADVALESTSGVPLGWRT